MWCWGSNPGSLVSLGALYLLSSQQPLTSFCSDMTQFNTPVKLVVSLLCRVKDMRAWLCFLQHGSCSSDPWGFCFVLLLLLVWFWFGWGFFVCLLAWYFRNKVLRYILCWSRICDVSQTGFELAVLLQLPRCWGYRPKVLTFVGQTTQSTKKKKKK